VYGASYRSCITPFTNRYFHSTREYVLPSIQLHDQGAFCELAVAGISLIADAVEAMTHPLGPLGSACLACPAAWSQHWGGSQLGLQILHISDN